MLYQLGEAVFITHSNEEKVIIIENLVSVGKDSVHSAFVRGTVYAECSNPETTHLYTTRRIVKSTGITVTIEISKLLRKLMLYPLDDSKYLIVDFQRPFNNLSFTEEDVIIPMYPVEKEMV